MTREDTCRELVLLLAPYDGDLPALADRLLDVMTAQWNEAYGLGLEDGALRILDELGIKDATVVAVPFPREHKEA